MVAARGINGISTLFLAIPSGKTDFSSAIERFRSPARTHACFCRSALNVSFIK
jgi:hypothetical protein